MMTTKVELSEEQHAGLEKIRAWLRDPHRKQVFRVFGYAGTGKTTLARYVAAHFDGETHFLAYTGKAALRLRDKGCAGARTIHRYLYDPVGEEELDEDGVKVYKPIFEAKARQCDLDFNDDEPGLSMAGGRELIVVDECSTIGRKLAEDLLARGLPIIVMGDPAQLPPIGDSGYFTESDEFPVNTPDVMLKEIHRQVADSPILKIATQARLGQQIRFGDYGAVRVVPKNGFENLVPDGREYDKDFQLICGTHRTRIALNRHFRTKQVRGELPEPGDRVICGRNKYRHGGKQREAVFMNGEIFVVVQRWEPSDEIIHLDLRSESTGKEFSRVRAWRRPFVGLTYQDCRMDVVPGDTRFTADEFEYAWAITCNKAQGSEWRNVTVYDESASFREHSQKWLYTALTRAADSLLLVR